MSKPSGPVLALLPYVSCSGLELFGIRFLKDLMGRGWPVAVASPADGQIAQQCAVREVPWLPLPVLYRWDPRAIWRLAQILRKQEPRAVIAFRTQAAYPLHLARLLTRRHCPLFLFYRLGAGNQPRRDPIHRRLFSHVAAVVPNADHVKNKILAKWAIAPERVVCIKSGIDTEKYRPDPDRRGAFRQALGIPDTAFLVGFTGRIHPQKGAETLLRALFDPDAGVAGCRPDVHLVYVGREHFPGYGDQLIDLARSFQAGNRFHLTGFRNDIEAIYPAFDLFVLAVESHETYAFTVLEAMASGVVPVVPFVGGMKEMFEPDHEGFFFEHRNRDSLHRVLTRTLTMPDADREAMGRAARARIMAHSDWHAMMNAYLRLFQECWVPTPALPQP